MHKLHKQLVKKNIELELVEQDIVEIFIIIIKMELVLVIVVNQYDNMNLFIIILDMVQ